jgi:hypothetical protein
MVFILPVTLPVRCTTAYCRVLTVRASACCSSQASSSASSANFCFLKVRALWTSAPTFALLSKVTLFRRVTGRSVTHYVSPLPRQSVTNTACLWFLTMHMTQYLLWATCWNSKSRTHTLNPPKFHDPFRARGNVTEKSSTYICSVVLHSFL